MSGAKLNLAELQSMIALGGYGGRGNNTPSTALLGLSAALFLSDLDIWQGAGDALTDAEIDDIEELVAQLEYDLMVEGDSPVNKIRSTHSVDQVIATGTVTKRVYFDTNIYDPENIHPLPGSPGYFYVREDGLYIINLRVLWGGSSVGYRQISVTKHINDPASTVVLATDIKTLVGGAIETTQQIIIQDEALIDDYYEVRCRHTSSGNLSIKAQTYSPFFEMVRL